MINGSTAFNNAVESGGYPYIARISKNGTVVDCDVLRCVIHKGATGEEDFTVGVVFVPYIELEITNLTTNLENSELKLEVGVQISSTETEWITIGYYTVTKISTSTVKTTLTAVGRISALLSTITPSVLTAPVTVASVLSDIQTAVRSSGYSAFTINYNSVDVTGGAITKNLLRLNCRDLLTIVTGLIGVYTTEDNAGNVVIFKHDTTTTVAFNGDKMIVHPAMNNNAFTLDAIKVVYLDGYESDDGTYVEEQSYSSGDSPKLTLKDEYMTTELLFNKFCTNCLGLEYQPGIISLAYGDPRLEASDVLEITDTDDAVYIMPCFNIVHTLAGGITSTITAPGQTDAEVSAVVVGPVTQQVKQLASDSKQTKDRLITAETSITQTATSIESLASNQSTYTKPDGTSGTNAMATAISQNASDITLRATTTDLTNEINARKAIYGTCSTGGSTAAKSVTCSNFARYTGAVVTVKFANANTATTPTLNVNSTGAATIKSYTGAALVEAEYKWAAGATLTFVFDGTYWRLQDSGSTAQIKVNADNINLRVQKNDVINQINVSTEGAQIYASKVDIAGAAVFNNYSTTTQMNTAIGNAVDGIEVGGRNILVETYASVSKATTATTSYVTQVLYHTPDLKTLAELGYKVDDALTLSFDWEVTSATTYGNARIEWYGYKSASAPDTYLAPLINPFATFSASNTSGHVVTTVKLTSTTINSKKLVLRIDNSNLTLTISNLKLEKGNKATDWTPAPEDVQANIDGIEVGGRNLARGTASMLQGTGAWDTGTWRTSGASDTFNYDVADSPVASVSKGILVTTATAGTRYGVAQDNCPMQSKQVTFSVWAKGTSGGTIRIQPIWWNGITVTCAKDFTATGEWQFVSYTADLTSVTVPNGECSIAYMYWTGVNANDTCVFVAPKLEYGNKPTSWTPAPEDVQSEIDAKKSVHTLMSSSGGGTYANILTWTAEGRANTSWGIDTTATPIDKIKVGDTVRVAYKVTDMGTSDNRPYVYVIGTFERSSGSTVYLTMHGLDTTIIDGGNILTNSIGANQIAANSIGAKHLTISDNTNLATANEMYESSLPPYSQPTAISGGYLVKAVATNQYLMVCDFTANDFKQNDELYYEFYGKAATAGSISLTVWGYTGTPPTHTSHISQGVSIALTTSEPTTPYSGVIKLTDARWNTATHYILGFSDGRSTKSQIYIKKLIIRRKNGGELIVDGSITADKLAANSIVVGKMNDATKSQVLNSNISVGGRNLLLKTGAPATGTMASDTNAQLNPYNMVKAYSELGLTTNDYVTLSFDYSYTNGKANGTIKFGTNASPWEYFGTLITTTAGSNSGHIESSYKVTSALAACTGNGLRIRTDGCNGMTLTVSNVKLEKGNKATDWTPAPEDVANDNLLSDSQKMTGWRLGSSATRSTSDVFGVATLNGTTANWSAELDSSPTISTSILDGTALWLSYEYKASVASNLYICLSGSSNAEGGDATNRTKYSANLSHSHAATTGWLRSVIKMPTSLSALNQGSGNVNSLYVQFYNRTDNSTVQIRKVKLERGSYASEWSSSPDDYKTYITRIDDSGIFVSPANQSPTTGTEGNSVKINASGMEVFKGGTSVASYSDTVRIGKPAGNNASRVEVDYHSLKLIAKEDGDANTYLWASDLRDSTGVATLTDIFRGDGETTYFQLSSVGSQNTPTIVSVTVGGTATTSYTVDALWTVKITPAPQQGKEIRITYKTNTRLVKAFTFGNRADSTIGPMSFTAGLDCKAEGFCSTAIGYTARALGENAVAIGDYAISNNGGYAIGDGVTSWDGQFVCGKHNIEDTNFEYIFIVGNGLNTIADNAFTIGRNGNVTVCQGDIVLNFYDNFSSGVDYEFLQAVTACGWDIVNE